MRRLGNLKTFLKRHKSRRREHNPHRIYQSHLLTAQDKGANRYHVPIRVQRLNLQAVVLTDIQALVTF